MIDQDELVIQDAQYSDQQAFKVEQLQQGARQEESLPGLHKQKYINMEVNVTPERPFPSGLVNKLQENASNPFKMVAPSTDSNSDIHSITQIVCFIVITLHFIAGLARLWCKFLLKSSTVYFWWTHWGDLI